MSYLVRVGFDAKDGIYYVLSSEIPSLNIETETFEEFIAIAKDAAPDLIGRQAGGCSITFQREVEPTG